MSNEFELVGQLELRYITKQKTPRPTLTQPKEIFDVAIKYYEQCELNIDYEEYVIGIFLSKSAKLIGCSTVGDGGTDSCLVSLQKVAATALLCGAKNVVLVHNHPQGKPNPSMNDRSITKDLHAALRTLDIRLLDHLIIGDYFEDGEHNYYSFNEHGEI